jgi:enolase
MMNILNGGAHADNNVDIQEFMIAPIGAPTFAEALRWGAEVYHALKAVLKSKGLSTGLGDEGGFAPEPGVEPRALDLIVEAIEKAGYTPGKDDRARARRRRHGVLHDGGTYEGEGQASSTTRDGRLLRGARRRLPDRLDRGPADEDDWDGWKRAHRQLGDKVQIVGDDLFVTNPSASPRHREGVANSLLVKVNQIGTLTETLDAVELAHRAGYTLHDEPPLRRDRGHDDRRPRGRHQLRPDQDRRAGPQRARRQVQPAAAHRGGARRRGTLRRSRCLPAFPVLIEAHSNHVGAV